MELFVIQCTTCHARLKVHDPAVIGQIVECPKCESFVAVTPPPGWQLAANSPASAATLPTDSGKPSAGSGILASASGGVPGAVPARATIAPVRAATASNAPIATGASVSNGAVSNNAVPNNTVSNNPVARGATPPPLPKKSGSSAAGISSSFVIKKAIENPPAPSTRRAAAVGAWAPHDDRAAAASTAAETPGEVVTSKRLAASVAMVLGSRYRWWIVGSTVGVLTIALAGWMFGRSHASTSAPDERPPVAGQVKDSATGEAVGHDSATTDPAQEAAETEPVAAVSPGNVQGDSETDSAATETPAAPALPAPSEEQDRSMIGAAAGEAHPTGLAPYGTTNGESPETSTGPTGSSAAAMEDGSDQGEAFDPVKQARLMNHLQDKLPAVEFTTIPLSQFVTFLSEYSTVPMVVDTASLAAAGKSAAMRISVKLEDTTVEEALKAALAKPGLAFHIEPRRLIITARAAKSK